MAQGQAQQNEPGFALMLRLLLTLCCLMAAVPAQAEDLPSLAKVYEGKFLFGFNGTNNRLVREGLADPASTMSQLVKGQSNIIGVNCFHPPTIHPKAGVWNWAGCDPLIAFIDQQPGWQHRGQSLFWPFNERANMEWMLLGDDGKPVSRDEAIVRLRNHIQTAMMHYKGRFQSWVVVNEVIDPDPRQTDGLRNGLWKDIVGPDLVEIAFRAARDADPSAKLFYNDFQTWRPLKRERIYAMVKKLKEKGLIDGIGLQQHVNLTEPTLRELDRAISRYATLGLEIHITELDVEVNKDGRHSELTPELEQALAQRYRDLFDVYLKHAGQITAVTTFNVTDASSWLRQQPSDHKTWPLLFDAGGRPKQAFWALAAPNFKDHPPTN